ncbi:MAG: hypothetical protein U1F00_23250 [Rhodoferax sp.]|nr:hypothetical protein [Rhodoferax sp.]
MPLRRRGTVTVDPLEARSKSLRTLPWADPAALERFRQSQPSAEDLAAVDRYQKTPPEFLANPYLRTRMLENELAQMLRTWMTAVEQTVDAESARKVCYAAGLAHGKRRLGTFLAGRGSTGGVEAMAAWQDTSHSSAGARHSSALFVRHDNELVEVVRTEDSFGMHTGDEPPNVMAFFDGLIDGYHLADPSLSYVEELVRERPDGTREFVHRFWYLPK